MASTAFLEQAYLGYFGRPVDPTGLISFINVSETDVENAFYASPESLALYGPTFGANQINAIYNMLFNRDAEPAGLAYWTYQVAIGLLSPAAAAVAIINGAQNEDAVFVANKLVSSHDFTVALDTTPEILGYAGPLAAASARAFLKTVTTAPATPEQVEEAVQVSTGLGGEPGQVFQLTVGEDLFVGTNGNDVFNAFVGENNSGDDISNLTAVDNLDGREGKDLLNLVVNTDFTIDPAMAGIEVISARFVGGTNASFDFANVSGVNTIQVKDTNSDYGYFNGWNVSDAIATYQFTNVARQTESVSITLEFNNDVFTGTSDAIDVMLQDAGNSVNDYWSNLYLDNNNGDDVIEILNVNSAGSDNQFYFGDSGLVTTVNAVGPAALNLELDSLAKLTKVDATLLDGGLTFDASGAGKDYTLTGSSGADTVTANSTKVETVDLGAGDDRLKMGTGANVTKADKYAGGDGSDTLVFDAATNAAQLVTDKSNVVFTGFDVLRLNSIDASLKITDFGATSVVIGGDVTAAALTLSGLASGASADVVFNGNFANSVALGVTGATNANTPNDTLTINLRADIGNNANNAVQLGVAGVNLLTVTANDADNSDAATSKDDGYTLMLTGAENVREITASGASMLAMDSSAFGGIEGVEFKGATATGNQAFIGTSFADIIATGAGNDTINAGNGTDTVDLTAGGNDTLALAIAAANRDTVTGFTSGASADVLGYLLADTSAASGAFAENATSRVANGQTVVVTTTGLDVVELKIAGGAVNGDLSIGTTGVELLKALAVDGTASGITTSDVGFTGYLAAYDNGNAYVYYANAGADAILSASEIVLVGTLNGVAENSLVSGNFLGA